MIGQPISVPEIFIITLIALLPLFVFSRIFSKAGYSGLLSLLLYIPVVNVILLIYFAYTEWPIERRLRNREK